MKKTTTVTAVFLFCFILGSCTTPAGDKPLTAKQIEKNIEKQLGVDVEYSSENTSGDKYYLFTYSDCEYYTDKKTGAVRLFYSNYDYKNEYSEELLDEEGARQAAIGELMKYCPEFFEYEYSVDTYTHTDITYDLFFYQLSGKGYKTGNRITAKAQSDGTMTSFHIEYNEDPSAVDAEYTVSQAEAIEISYESAKKNISYTSPYDEKAEIYFDERETHELNIYLTCSSGVQVWQIDVDNIETDIPKDTSGSYPILYFSATIDANTGEVINFYWETAFEYEGGQ